MENMGTDTAVWIQFTIICGIILMGGSIGWSVYKHFFTKEISSGKKEINIKGAAIEIGIKAFAAAFFIMLFVFTSGPQDVPKDPTTAEDSQSMKYVESLPEIKSPEQLEAEAEENEHPALKEVGKTLESDLEEAKKPLLEEREKTESYLDEIRRKAKERQ